MGWKKCWSLGTKAPPLFGQRDVRVLWWLLEIYTLWSTLRWLSWWGIRRVLRLHVALQEPIFRTSSNDDWGQLVSSCLSLQTGLWLGRTANARWHVGHGFFGRSDSRSAWTDVYWFGWNLRLCMEACKEFLKHESWSKSAAVSALEASTIALVDLTGKFSVEDLNVQRRQGENNFSPLYIQLVRSTNAGQLESFTDMLTNFMSVQLQPHVQYMDITVGVLMWGSEGRCQSKSSANPKFV